eukprot:13769026-Alexandrium_andersonii.AAC.1
MLFLPAAKVGLFQSRLLPRTLVGHCGPTDPTSPLPAAGAGRILQAPPQVAMPTPLAEAFRG